MSINRQAAQRDANEGELVKAFRRCGWRVQRHTAWDLDVLCPRCKFVTPVEVKAVGKGLTKSQKDLVEAGWPLQILRSTKDVDELIGDHAKECRAMGV